MSEDQLSKKELKALHKEKIKELEIQKKTAIMKICGIFIATVVIIFGFFLIAKALNAPKARNQTASLVNIVTYKDWAKGSENPAVEIVAYSNFICDECEKIDGYLKQAELEFQSKIRVVFRHFYQADEDKKSAFIAKFIEAAGLQNKFWGTYNELLKNKEILKNTMNITPILTQISKNTGLDIEKINETISNQKISEKISRDLGSASSTSVSSAPTIFIKDLKIDSLKNYDNLKIAIEKALQKKVE